MRTPFLALVFCFALLPAMAQSSPECPMHPQTLAQMRDCYRPLLIFAPTADDPRLGAERHATCS